MVLGQSGHYYSCYLSLLEVDVEVEVDAAAAEISDFAKKLCLTVV